MQKLLYSSLLSKNIKIKKYRTIILPVFFLYECETCLVTLREECRLRVFENRVLRRIFGPKRDDVTGEWRRLYDGLNDLYSSPNIIRLIKSRRMEWVGQEAYVAAGEVHTLFWLGNLKKRDHVEGKKEDLAIDGRIIRWIFRKWEGGVIDWLRTGTGGGHL